MQQEEEDEEEEIRVFVNNQNTRAATVTIPTRIKRRQSRALDAPHTGLKQPLRHLGAGGGPIAGKPPAGAAEDINNKHSSGHNEKRAGRATASIVHGDVHPHLEDVYQRVMRRLQRRANYEEVRCPSLAVQFGLVDAGEEERNRERADWDVDDHHTSLLSTSSSTTGGGKSSLARRRQQHQQHQHYQQQQPLQHGGKETSRGLNFAKNNDGVDDTDFLSQQPCPKTLRLVLEQVTSIVTEKLRIADVGSLKDCLRQVFESRTMLDRLLKEVPTYAQFQGDVERLPTAMQLHEVYQEFRQKPTVLPSAAYARDPVSGRVVATVGEARDDISSLTQTLGSIDIKQKQSQQQQQEEEKEKEQQNISSISSVTPASALVNTDKAPVTPTYYEKTPSGLSHVTKVSLPGGISLTIPANYAKSSRTRQNAGARSFYANRSTTTGTTTNTTTTNVGGTSSRLASTHPESTAERGEESGQGSIKEKRAESTRPNTSASASVSVPSTTTTIANVNADNHTNGVVRPSSGSSRHGGNGLVFTQTIPATERWRQETQLVSVGVITDINNSTVVSREEYEKLMEYSKKLEVDIEEQKQEIQELTKELNEEKAYTSQKKKVVQYLRETLYKECTVLRSQLSTAQQKQIQYQALLKEQQQQQQQVMAYAASLEARSGAGASVYEPSRFPNINTTRAQASEASAMMMSVTPGMFSVRRANPNASVFGLARPSINNVEEHDEASHSALAGASVFLGTPAPAPLVQQQQQQISVDVMAIQSLLDLVLLAVEKDQVLPGNVSKAKHANMNIIASAMEDDPHAREQKLRTEFAERHQQIKQSYTLNRVQTTNMLAAKDEQIKYLKKSSDLHFLRRYWNEKGEIFRNELRRLRHGVLDELENLKHFVITTMESIANRARVVDTTLRDNHSLYSTQSALRDIISSARALLLPMLTTEYARGYHPWPLKLRNTMDPFSHMVKARYGDGQLLMIRDELNSLSDIYVMLHHYVMKSERTLQLKRPTPGKTLELLCSALVLNSAATSEIWIQVREKYALERELQRKIAKLNMTIIAMVYRQRILAERSTEAIREAGMDPRLISLPAQRTINKIAENVHKVVTERAQLRKQRQDNARDVYRIWKTKQIDVNEGYPPPTAPQKLVLGEVDVFRQTSIVALPLSGSGRMRMGTDSLARTSVIQGQAKSFWERMLSTSVEEKLPVEPPTELTPSEIAGSSMAHSMGHSMTTTTEN